MSGLPPKNGWSKLVPELLVQDIVVSLVFWQNILGFVIAYDRPEQLFAYLERPEGSQVMLCQRSGKWETAEMAQPFGRGVMFQIQVDDLDPIIAAIAQAKWPVHSPLRDVWRQTGDRESGQREIFLTDPDGYLIMMNSSLGQRGLKT